MASAGQRSHLQFHQPLGGKADHLPQQIGISTLFQQAAKAHHLVGHRLYPWFGVRSRNQTLPKISDDHPLIAGEPGDDAFGRYAPYVIIPRKTVLHHSMGHDRRKRCNSLDSSDMHASVCDEALEFKLTG